MKLLIWALATWRVSRMLVSETGPFGAFYHVRVLVEDQEARAQQVFSPLTCVGCTSLYVAPLLLLIPSRVREVLAVSALAKLVDDYFYGTGDHGGTF